MERVICMRKANNDQYLVGIDGRFRLVGVSSYLRLWNLLLSCDVDQEWFDVIEVKSRNTYYRTYYLKITLRGRNAVCVGIVT